MKRLSLILIFCLLTACGKPQAELPADFSPAYTAEQVPLDGDVFWQIKGNGTIIVGARYDNYEDEDANGELYLLELRDSSMHTTSFSDFHGLKYYNFLGLDGSDGVWITGTGQDDRVNALRLDTNGTVLLSLVFDETVPYGGVFSFTWDENYYYFLVHRWSNDPTAAFDDELMVFDLGGNAVFRRSLADYSLDIIGYLAVEADWLEDLEGREDDRLLEQLFPESFSDVLTLIRLQDGSPGMLICRKAPIGEECYGLICPFDTADFSIAPAFSYPIENKDTLLFASTFASSMPDYDLLVIDSTHLLGVNLEEQSLTPLFAWQSIDYPVPNLASECTDCVCQGPDGSLLLISWDTIREGVTCDILRPVS